MNFRPLKEFFANFLHNRHIARHFRRLTLLDTMTRAGVNREVSATLSEALQNAARSDIDVDVRGLTEEDAEAIAERVGLNEVEHEKPLLWWSHLWHCYTNPFNLLLTILAMVSYVTRDASGALVIIAMVLLSTFLRFWQEGKSNRAADALKAMVSNTATVLRRDMPDGVSLVRELPIQLLVPGDIVLLSAGDMIPADCRLLVAKDLFVAQSAMTGESMPVEKFSELRHNDTENLFDLDNIIFMATNVVSGSARAVVIATGNNTYFGALATRVTANDRTPTAFQSGVNRVSWLLLRFMFVMVPFVLFINGFTKGNWVQAVLFALSVAVGLTPEMLPMIVTSTLAKGAVILSRKKVIVKRLDAIQNFGAMDVLCTDKTGTLTQDKVFLSRHTDVWGEDSDDVLEMAYLNSYYQTGLKNLLDIAVLELVDLNRTLNPARNYRKVDEIPFDFTRRRMSVVVSEREDHHELICKGAVDEILSVCTKVRQGESSKALTLELLQEIRRITGDLNEEGLRVVAVAAKELPPSKEVYGIADECELTLMGYVAFLDPPKDSTAPALEALAAHGVSVKVLTGDNERVTSKICREVGLEEQGIVLGKQIDQMSDAELSPLLETHNVFAKLTPTHKERIIRLLKNNGHVVGFLGDGINDAAALRAADIGVSVDTAVDIAKEAADIILLEKSLMVLEEGVLEGRRTFCNMLKYIRMAASSNFGNVFSILIASVCLPFLPMLPLQLLTQNLLYDMSQVAIPFDHVDEELIAKPQHWQTGNLGRFMIFFGPMSSIFDIITFLLMWFIFGANTLQKQALFQSGWFVVGLLTQTMIIHMMRTPKLPFIQSRAATPLMITTLVIMTIGVLLPMGPWAHYFRFVSLPPLYFVFLPMIVISYIVLTQAMKRFYIRRFGWQ